ncbi:MAG: acyl-CoA dehydrogenase family protein [Elusimicrobia bacterium]|nr:acyl-CoA dehydrogenase family protein [Elusimicrobiota bacterium]
MPLEALSEAQKMARDSARDFAEKRLKPVAQKLDEDEAIPRELYAEAAELGFLGMMLPEEYGGLGLDYMSYVLAMEELARGSAAFQVGLTVHNSLVCSGIYRFGTDEQKKRYLPKMAKGEWVGSYCLSESGAGSDAGSLSASASAEGEFYILNGAKAWVTNGGFAHVFMVFVSTRKELGSRGVSCILVEKGTPGFEVGKKEKKLGIRASDTRELSFNNCRVPKSQRLGAENEGFQIAKAQLESGRVSIAAQAVGIAQAAFEEAVCYAKARRQFGKALSEFQATQFKIADMAAGIDAARLLTYRAAMLINEGRPCGREASIAKLFSSQMCNRVAYDALQIHGGNGYIREFPVERYFRDARITEIYEGTSEIQRLIIAKDVLKS